MTRKKKWRSLGFSVLLCVFLSFCKTAPSTNDALLDETETLPLEPGAQLYVLADVQAFRPVLELLSIREFSEQGMDKSQLQEMLDRTKSAAAALYRNERERHFQVTAWGHYPKIRAGMALNLNPEWKKQKTGAGLPYWSSTGRALSLALNSKQIFASSFAEGPFASLPGTAVPEGFTAFRRGAVFSCWMEKPADSLNQVFAQMEIPLQMPAERILFSLFPAADSAQNYMALIHIQTASVSHARSLAALIGLAHNFGFGSSSAADPDAAPDLAGLAAEVFFANPPVQDGKNILLKTAVLSKNEIALLFNIFSIYF
jgi:hypothetical protein